VEVILCLHVLFNEVLRKGIPKKVIGVSN